MPVLLDHIRVQNAFLLQVVRDRVLCQQGRLQTNLGADPFTFQMGTVCRVVAGTARAEPGTKLGALNLIELLEVAPSLIADGSSNINL